jgi:chain length determinant protein (polysaccharide antigen chain regulator)
MTQNNNSQVSRSNDPEQIDLLDLMLQLWRGKWMIATFVVVFIALAIGYLSVAKENGPQVRLLRNLMRLRLQPILMH